MTVADDDDESERTIVGRPILPVVEASAVGHFVVFSESGEQRRVQVPSSGMTIGRTAPGDLAIQSPDISRRHCRIDLDGEWALLTDLGSTNGTFLGGERVERPVRLQNGNVLSLGSFQIRYERRDMREVAEERELTADLRRAADYVRAILPRPIEDGPIRAEWHFVPSSQLGGDAFGYQFLDDTTFTGFVLDVSGHGIGSAMHAVNVANVLRRRGLPGVDFHDPAEVASGLNAMFPMEDHNDLMLTLWYFVYDLAGRVLRFCSAGHHASFLVSPETPEPASLWQRSPAIGMLSSGKWTAGTAEIAHGGKLYIFSDGAFEIVDAGGQNWGIDDLRRIIARPESNAEGIWRKVRESARPGPLDDDFSVLVVTFP